VLWFAVLVWFFLGCFSVCGLYSLVCLFFRVYGFILFFALGCLLIVYFVCFGLLVRLLVIIIVLRIYCFYWNCLYWLSLFFWFSWCWIVCVFLFSVFSLVSGLVLFNGLFVLLDGSALVGGV